MKNIAQFVNDGINNLPELIAALETAMRLEFSTLPPYLCAQWSINQDPDSVASIIEDIAVQEMYHFALVGNILSAIGHSPRIAYPEFLPIYPTNKLPGDIYQKLPIDLKPLTVEQLDVFMQIENPQFDPVVIRPPDLSLSEALIQPPATIGDFYDTLTEALRHLNPEVNANAKFVNLKEAVPIKSIGEALDAITLIKDEGEGTPDSPGQSPSDKKKLAHFYSFQMIKLGKRYIFKDGKWVIDPASKIQLPTVFDFGTTAKTGSENADFSKILTDLLKSLESCWKRGARPDIGLMDNLQDSGSSLIAKGIRPDFKWSA